MKCQKCAKPAIVHLTEVVSDPQGGGTRRAVEIHLCLMHAVEVGLVTAGPGLQVAAPQSESAGAGPSEEPQAIVPAEAPGGLAVSRDGGAAEGGECPICGLQWNNFKQAGLMGCPHDYEQFGAKLLPLLKRAQEGATEHMGKLPARRKTVEADRQVTTLRLRRELQKAVDAENYEQAARLRDQLRQLGQN